MGILEKEKNEDIILKNLLKQALHILVTSYSAEDLFLCDTDYEKLTSLMNEIIETLSDNIAMYDKAIEERKTYE